MIDGHFVTVVLRMHEAEAQAFTDALTFDDPDDPDNPEAYLSVDGDAFEVEIVAIGTLPEPSEDTYPFRQRA